MKCYMAMSMFVVTFMVSDLYFRGIMHTPPVSPLSLETHTGQNMPEDKVIVEPEADKGYIEVDKDYIEVMMNVSAYCICELFRNI